MTANTMLINPYKEWLSLSPRVMNKVFWAVLSQEVKIQLINNSMFLFGPILSLT